MEVIKPIDFVNDDISYYARRFPGLYLLPPLAYSSLGNTQCVTLHTCVVLASFFPTDAVSFVSLALFSRLSPPPDVMALAPR